MQPRRHLICRIIAGWFIAAMASCGVLRAQSVAADLATKRIGVVNLRLVFSNMQETIDVKQKLADRQADLKNLTDADQSQLKALREKISSSPGLAAGDQEQAVDDIDEKTVHFEVQEQKLKTEIMRLQTQQLKQAFGKINSAAADLAKTKNLDAIFVDSGVQVPPFPETMDQKALVGALFNRSTLYAEDTVDVTSALIAQLNAGYKSSASPAALPALPMTTLKIGSKTYHVEIAADDASREHGLMERDTLAKDYGMMFVFAQATEQSFWMHHTRFPLDILFVNARGKIVSVHTMKEYDETPIPSDGPSKYAIEIGAGEAATASVKQGDELKIPPEADAALTKQ